MELIFLGTGAGLPSKSRNVTSIALMLNEERGTVWLFDCGEGTQHQILNSRVRPSKIERIFISHMHGDHIFGLPGLLSSRSFQGGEDKVKIYGPKGIKAFLECTIDVSKTRLTYDIEIIEVAEGSVFKDNQFEVKAFELDHVIECYGFRVEEADKTGALDVEALKEFNIPKGPLFGKLKAGETVTLEDGTMVCGADYLKEPKKGKVIAVSGDTRKTKKTIAMAQDADWLIHEATFRKGQEEQAEIYGHSTNVEAASVAKDAQVKNLLLTHISSRFSREDLNDFLLESKAVFSNSILVEDLTEIKL